MKKILSSKIYRILVSILLSIFIPVPIYDSCMSACGSDNDACFTACIPGFKLKSFVRFIYELIMGFAVNDISIDWRELLLLFYFMFFCFLFIYHLLAKWSNSSVYLLNISVPDRLKGFVSVGWKRFLLIIIIASIIPIPFYVEEWALPDNPNLSTDVLLLPDNLNSSPLHFAPIIYGFWQMVRVSMVYKFWIYSLYDIFYPLFFYIVSILFSNKFFKRIAKNN